LIKFKKNIYFIFLFFAISATFFLIDRDYFSILEILKIYFLNLLLIFPLLFYGFHFFVKKNSYFSAPLYLLVFCLINFIFYSSFFFTQQIKIIDQLVLNKLLNYLILSFLFFFIGYFIFHYQLIKKKIYVNFFQFNYPNLILYIIFFYLFLFYFFENNISIFYSYFLFIKNFFYFLLAVLLANFCVEKNYYKNFLLFLLFLVLLIFDASSSLVLASIIYFSCFIFALTFLRKKIPFLLIIFFIFYSFSVEMIKYPYRLNLSKSDEKNVIYRSVLFTKYIINYYSKTEIFINGENRFENDKTSNKQFIYFSKIKENQLRIYHSIFVFLSVTKLTPETVPYYSGNSYKKIFYKFIPRPFFPNKPIENDGNMWGHRYGALDKNDFSTSWNFPVLSEFYANYGLAGCIFGMFLIGLMLRFMSIPLTNKNNNNQGNLIAIAVFYQFLFQETNLSQVLGGVIYFIIFAIIFFTILYKISKI
jgi:hypothetical protein